MSPAWAQRLTELYFSGSTVLFALHSSVQALVPNTDEFTALPDLLGPHIFGRTDLMPYYNLGQVQR